MKIYIVGRAMTANGKDYARGDERELTESDALPLVQIGALTEKKAAPAKAPANKSKG